MSPHSQEKHALLAGQDFDEERKSQDRFHDNPECRLRFYGPVPDGATKSPLRIALAAGLAFSIFANLLLVAALFVVLLQLRGHGSAICKPNISPYAGVYDDPSVPFPHSVGYGPEITNHTLAYERWEAIDISAGVVALPEEWAAEHNLPPAQPFPWDTTKSVYALTAFHTLHCLKTMHHLLYKAHHGLPFASGMHHALHCLDHMRKDTMCNADDYLLSSPPGRYGSAGPRGQARVCRDWNKLVDWANQYNACYQQINDDEVEFEEGHEEMERYFNCPPGSPYEAKMKAYMQERAVHLLANK